MSEDTRYMLRPEIKTIFILIGYSFFLQDILTAPTLALVLLGSILVWLRIRPAKWVRNLCTLGLFVFYWMSYGKVIDPEIGLNFLTSIIVFKVLEKESLRDRYMIFFGLILVISAGTLFVKNLSYVFFFGISFFVLIQDFYQGLQLKQKVSDLGKSLLWVLPLTGFLFFFLPRLSHPFSSPGRATGPGEIGYTPDVNLSEVDSLTSNERPVFQALVPEPISPGSLYWRGNTISFSDGWNWTVMPQDRESGEVIQETLTTGFMQKIRLYHREDFFFALDRGSFFRIGDEQIRAGLTGTLVQKRWSVLNYEASSILPQNFKSSHFPGTEYLRVGLKKEDINWINQHFSSQELDSLTDEIKNYLQTNSFSYTLKPGRISSFKEFIQTKKTGFCSHYASSIGLIMRSKGIPTRLVSGFLGGNYNRYGGFYLISQNDAHVWLEAWENGSWKRLDPTAWIAPERVSLGGEAFMRASSSSAFNQFSFSGFSFITDFQQWFEQWDFRFYQWLEDMDYYGQQAFFARLNFKREWFYKLAPLLLILFTGLYGLWLFKFSQRPVKSALNENWKLFHKKMQKRGTDLSFISIREMEQKLDLIIDKDKAEILAIWQLLVKKSFQQVAVNDAVLRRRIKRL
jgi:protein-glutamine gamma-glutamyltransferase